MLLAAFIVFVLITAFMLFGLSSLIASAVSVSKILFLAFVVLAGLSLLVSLRGGSRHR